MVEMSSFQLGILSFFVFEKMYLFRFWMEDASSYVDTSKEQSRVIACQK
jgi:hypothetical protein